MYRRQSPCGRLAPKPELKHLLETSELMEEAMPIHQQIENLRTKIALKERYNNVLKYELEESREGATSVLKDLYDETQGIRLALIDAVGKEKFAVQNALRTHRLFQLALRSKTPEFAINWLDDKLFDFAKKLNLLVDQLLTKRRKLHEAENMVFNIEKWPKPGSFPWEAKMEKRIMTLHIDTTKMGVKLETARLLNIKYQEIKSKLHTEEEHYAPVIMNLDTQHKNQTEELKTLQQMLDDAEFFQADAATNLESTEQEASVNRKKRRIQMAKIKKAVEKVLEENKKQDQQQPTEPRSQGSIISRKQTATNNIPSVKILEERKHSHGQLIERLKYKRAEIEKLQVWVYRLVETMRVHDITHVPIRLSTVIKLGDQLTEERNTREELRQVLVHQRDQLLLILHYIRYTGSQEEVEYNSVISDYDKTLENLESEVKLARKQLGSLGDITSGIRLGMVSILNQLEKTDLQQLPVRHPRMKSSNQLIKDFPIINEKIQKLVSSVDNLKSQFESPAERDYSQGVRPPPVPDRLIRVGSPHVSDASDDDDYDDYKVPCRADILARSQKVILQGKLRRGIN